MKLSAEPRSDQINADDLIAGPQTFTIAGVGYGKATAKYDVELVESPGRCWRPPLTMLRLLFKAWGDEANVWVGRRVTLFTDPTVTFGKDKVGGIRISHLSHIDKTVSVNPQVTRGKRKLVSAEPLIEQAPTPPPVQAPVRDWHAEAVACTSEDALKALWMDAQASGAPQAVLDGISGMAANFAAPTTSAEDAQKILAAVREDNHEEA